MSLRKLVTESHSFSGRRWALIGAGLVFVLSALLGGLLLSSFEEGRRQRVEIQARQLASAVAHDLGERLDHSLSATTALTAVLRQGNGQIDDFPRLARELIDLFGGISALQLAPGGVITEVEPLAGNERVIGFSPINDPVQGPEARRVIESRKIGLIGPFALRQGGVGVVGRNPVFLRDQAGNESFWGLVQVLIRVPDLLVATPLQNIEAAGYHYELWHRVPGQADPHVFARSVDTPLEAPIEVRIAVPNDEWVLGVAPARGWQSMREWRSGSVAVGLVSLLIAVVAYLALRQPQLLRSQVAARTAALQASEEKYRELVDLAASILLKWDRAGRVVFLNEFGQRFFGYREEEIVGQSVVGSILPRQDSAGQDLSQLMDDIFNRPEAYESNLNENVRRNGERVWIAWRNRAIRDATGAAVGMFSVGIDITEQRRAEIALQAANQRFERLNAELEERVQERSRQLESEINERRATEKMLARNERMAALGSLVAGVAHEINTPIGNALMVATTARQQVAEFEKVLAGAGVRRSQLDGFVAGMRTSADMLERNLDRAADLIRNFKQVAVDQASDRRRSFELAATLEEIRMTLAPRFDHSPYRLTVTAEAGVVLDSYPGGFGQIVVNLVDNALHHAFEGRASGGVHIEARRLSPDQVEVCFSDDGTGIPAAILPRIFDPFFTTRLGRGGSGLGLSIVHNLAHDLLGGELTVSSQSGQGSCFRLVLPVHAPEPVSEPGTGGALAERQ